MATATPSATSTSVPTQPLKAGVTQTAAASAGIWHEPALARLRRFEELGRRAYYLLFRSGWGGGAQIRRPGAPKRGSFVPVRHAATRDNYDETDLLLSEAVRHAGAEFARTGVPRYVDQSVWPAFQLADWHLTVIDSRAEPAEATPGPVPEMVHAVRGGDRSGAVGRCVARGGLALELVEYACREIASLQEHT